MRQSRDARSWGFPFGHCTRRALGVTFQPGVFAVSLTIRCNPGGPNAILNKGEADDNVVQSAVRLSLGIKVHRSLQDRSRSPESPIPNRSDSDALPTPHRNADSCRSTALANIEASSVTISAVDSVDSPTAPTADRSPDAFTYGHLRGTRTTSAYDLPF